MQLSQRVTSIYALVARHTHACAHEDAKETPARFARTLHARVVLLHERTRMPRTAQTRKSPTSIGAAEANMLHVPRPDATVAHVFLLHARRSAACYRHTSHTPTSKLGKQTSCTCRDPGLSRGPSDLQSDALPTELSRPWHTSIPIVL